MSKTKALFLVVGLLFLQSCYDSSSEIREAISGGDAYLSSVPTNTFEEDAVGLDSQTVSFPPPGSRTLTIPSWAARDGHHSPGGYTATSSLGYLSADSKSDTLNFPVILPSGVTLVGLRCKMFGAGQGSKYLFLQRHNKFYGAPSRIGIAVTSQTQGSQYLTFDPFDYLVVAGNPVWASFRSGDAGDKVLYCEVAFEE